MMAISSYNCYTTNHEMVNIYAYCTGKEIENNKAKYVAITIDTTKLKSAKNLQSMQKSMSVPLNP